MNINKELSKIISEAGLIASLHEFFTPEHVVLVMCKKEKIRKAFEKAGLNPDRLHDDLKQYIDENIEQSSDVIKTIESQALEKVIINSAKIASKNKKEIDVQTFFKSVVENEDSYVSYFIQKQNVNPMDVVKELSGDNDYEIQDELKQFLTNLNEQAKEHKEPIIGREDVLKRTIQILCRKQKNNPVHVGEPGVGKTAVTIGLAKMINDDKVPEVLKGSTLFSLDLASIMAGTKYRGDFEDRFKKILNYIEKTPKAIVYIDEIHNIVGTGASGESTLDMSNILKPYLTGSKIKFIGATTYDEYKKHFEKDKALIRRFQTIDIKEPTVEEAIKIIEGIKPYYEEFHNIKYSDDAIKSAVELSHQYINNRYLPDKAIDIIDEAGAITTVDEKENGYVVTKQDIETVISKMCNIPKKSVETDEVSVLQNLEQNLKQKVFGQNEAVEQIVKCIKMSRAGLGDDEKPIANLLFVGPTGTGKTEIAKQLSNQLGVKLLRYDMSEYAEQHSVSKLIGAPAGYVGYEEGGKLVEDIKKHPHCVLLLDEIEKAHKDIYNILLQIMDYATLTDNQGRKADFKNVILIMTSNAGASNVGKTNIGFGDREVTYEAIDEAVKKTFSPEFRARLTEVIAFNKINDQMAISIAEKTLNEFKDKLVKKNVEITWTKNTAKYIAEKGVSLDQGARQIKKIVDNEVKPLLIDEILFGKLKSGGKCKLSVENAKIKLVI